MTSDMPVNVRIMAKNRIMVTRYCTTCIVPFQSVRWVKLRPTVLLSGDFRVTVTCVETTDNGFEMALLNSSNTKQYNLTFSWASGKDWNNNGTQLVTNISAVTDSPVVMERVGSTLTVKCNGTQLLTRSITTADVYYAFGTHSQGSRYCIIKDLMIEAL